MMHAFLYVLLGLSLGAGLTLIALQERFVRERRRLLALGEAQRAKTAQTVDELGTRLEQQTKQHQEELRACQARLAAAEAAPATAPAREGGLEVSEYERLIEGKTVELNRLATENTALAEHLASHRAEIKDLQGQVAFLHGEVTRLEGETARLAAEKEALPDDDFLLLGQPGGHMLPGSVVRAFIKRSQQKHP